MFVPSLPTLVYKDDTKQIINVVIFTCNDSLPTSVLGYIYIYINHHKRNYRIRYNMMITLE